MLVTGTVLATGIAIGTYTVIRSVLLESARQEASLKVQYSAARLDTWLAQLKAEITTLASTPSLRTQNWESVAPYLKEVGGRLGDFDVLAFTLPDGTIYDTHINTSYNLPDGIKPFKVSDRAWFQSALGGTITASDPFISRGTGRTQINIASPIFATSQTPLAVLSGSVTIERIEQELNELRFGQGSYAFALNSRSQAIAHPDPIYRNTAERPGPLFVESENSDLKAVAQQMINRQRGIVLVSANNTQNYYAYAPLQEANWSLAVVIPRQNVEGRLQSLDLLAICFAMALVAASVGGWRQWKLSQKTVAQVQQLKEQEQALTLNQQSLQTSLQELKTERQKVEQANEEIHKLNIKLKAENLRMTAELTVAQQLQEMILPKSDELDNISDLDIAGYMKPADEVGGDYYDIISRDHKIQVVIGDVTGHGLVSGVIMLMAQTATRALLSVGDFHPTAFLQRLNETLYYNLQRIGSDRTMTLSILEYDQSGIRLTGQHESVLIVRADGSMEEVDTDELGFPIGLEADISPFTQEILLPLAPGDIVTLYTDGIPEAVNAQQKFYGLKRMHEVIQKNRHLSASDICHLLIADLTEHVQGHVLYDDITLLIIKKKASDLASTAALPEPK
ncbi:MAG: SpoIIE family protein phosphatase [Cyanobacteriota bacterium]|nr:SpoIIE family protein phosphatase [Cyanobacteriota bacterium]